jgi:hypothetical protein
MADFGRVLAAADAAGVTDGALDRFRNQHSRIAAEVLDADSFCTAVAEHAGRGVRWQGTATELLNALAPDSKNRPHDWPKANGVVGRLKRLVPALSAHGVKVHIPRARSNKGRIFMLESIGNGSSLSSQPSPVVAAQSMPE